MRGIILALLLALASSEKSQNEQVLNSAKTYEYAYEGYATTGIPENGLNKAGLKIRATLQLGSAGPNTILGQLFDIDVKEYNGQWPTDPFTRSLKLTKAIAEHMQKPFKFEYHHGKVGDIFTASSVPRTIVNLIRGILNLLQAQIRKSENMYDVEEDSIAGRCITRYAVQEDEKKAGSFVVIKSQDLEQCLDSPVKRIGLVFAEPCRQCQQMSKHLRRVQTVSYKLRYKGHEVIVDEIRARQQIHYALFHEFYGAATTEVSQALILKSIKSSSSLKEPRQQLENRGGLSYRFGDEVWQMPIHLMKQKDTETQIADILQNLVQNNQPEVQKEAPAKFMQLLQLLRDTKEDDLQAVIKQYVDKPQHEDWLKKAVPMIGTAEAINLVRKNIPHQSIHQATMDITDVMLHTRASQRALQLAAELLRDEDVRRIPELLRAAYLAFGIMINKYCSLLPACPESALQPLHDFAAEASSSNHVKDMVTALKALGNAGQPQSFKRILKFIPGLSTSANNLPTQVKVAALWALRNIAKREPKRVQEIWLAVALDQHRLSEVRMMAIAALLQSRPPAATVIALAQGIQRETRANLQVASFTYSFLKSLARAKVPEYIDLRAASRIAIKLLNPALDKMSMRYSKAFHISTFNYPLMTGAAADVLIMNSPITLLPSNIIIKVRGYTSGAAADLIEIHLRAEGLQALLKKGNFPYSEYSARKVIMKIIEALSGFRNLALQAPLASSSIKVLGQEIHFHELTKENLISTYGPKPTEAFRIPGIAKKIIKGVAKGIWHHLIKPHLFFETRHIIPTAMGFPLEMGLHSAAVGGAVVNAEMKVNPPLNDDVSIFQLLHSAVQLTTELIPSAAVHAIASMGINTRLVQSAVELHSKAQAAAQFKLNIKFDGREQNLKVEIEPVQQEKTVFVMRTQAVAASRNVEDLENAKKTPIIPKGAEPSIMQKRFEKSSRVSAEGASLEHSSSELGAKKFPEYAGDHNKHRYSLSQLFHVCIKSRKFNTQICVGHKSKNIAGRKHFPLYQIVGDLETTVTTKPIQKDVTIEKVTLEVTTGPKAELKIISLSDFHEQQGEHLLDPAPMSRLKTILGLDEEATNTTLAKSKRRIPKKDIVEAKTKKGHQSSSSSDSSSYQKGSPKLQHQQQKRRQQSSSSSQSGSNSSQSGSSSKQSSSSSSSSSGSSSDSSSSSSSSSQKRKGGKGHRGSRSQQYQSSGRSSNGGQQRRDSSSSSSSSSSQQSQSNQYRDQHHNTQQQRNNKRKYKITLDDEQVELAQRRFRRPRKEEIRTISGRVHSARKASSSSSSSSSSSRRSSSSSSAADTSRRPGTHPKFLGGHKSPSLVATLQAVRSDNKKQGYQLIVFTDYHSSKPKVQAFVVDITKESRWRACINAKLDNPHEAEAEVRWGKNCQQYKVTAWAETGRLGNQPALRLKAQWSRVPAKVKRIAKVISSLLPGAAYMVGFTERYQKNPARQIKVVLSLINPRTANAIIKMPKLTLVYEAMKLLIPITTPWNIRPAEVPIPVWNVFADLPDNIAEGMKGSCLIENNAVTTFNDVSYKYEMPGTCYHVLAQDSSEDYKFLVMAKNSMEDPALKDINIKLGDFDIDLHTVSGKAKVKVNGIDIAKEKLPYIPSEEPVVQLEQEDEKIVLSAPDFGLDKLVYDGKSIKVVPTVVMTGSMAGLCGRYDAETEQEFRRPDGSITNDASSFGHSWILAGEACSGSCKLQHSLVKTERAESDEPMCYSTHPVLRCAEGCTATATTPVSVSYYCNNSELEEGMSMAGMPEDFAEKADAHISCSCESQTCGA
ncbi:vitellogenin-A2-like [Hyperolius riggenbachi]|uniref:vitellogenin-A2-like n=1 Tax=Hyperolius riggenbachi TaxID=752182 RepID=UPI0035A35858